jgi:membrane-associated phospholipid phosphatase
VSGRLKLCVIFLFTINFCCARVCHYEHHGFGGVGYWFMEMVETLAHDFAQIHAELWSLDTVKIVTATAPAYLVARWSDPHVHTCFYDATFHKNKCQTPWWFSKLVEKSADVGSLIYISFAVIAPNQATRHRARIFGVGLLSVLVVKDLIKSLRSDANLRPFNEYFRRKRTFGGFPSGHMIESAYLATVLGLEYGPILAIPLTAAAGLMFGVLVGSNRHYASQVVVGAALGVAYGLAVHKTIGWDLEQLSWCISCDQRGSPHIGFSYQF